MGLLGGIVGGVIGGIPGAIIGGNDRAKNWLLGGDATKNLDGTLHNYDAASGQLGQIAKDAANRRAPTMQAAQLGQAWQLQGGPQDQARAGMMGVTNRLGQIATGQQAGAGELAVNRQVSATNAAQQAAARATRGAGAALAFRNAARTAQDINLAGAGQAAQAQIQDQAAANQQLGAMYGAMRGQDIDFASQNAQLGQQQMLQQGAFNQQAGLANQQAALTQQQMNDAQQINALGQQLGWDQARVQAELQKAGIVMSDKGMLPGLLQMGGQIGAAYATGGASSMAARAPQAMSSGRPMAQPWAYGSSDLMDPRYA